MKTLFSHPTRYVLFVLAVSAASAGIGSAAPAPGAGRVQLVIDLQGLGSPVAGVAFSPDEKHVAACAGKEVRIWDLETGQLHYTLRGQIDSGSYGDCLAVAFSPDNCFLVVGIANHTELGSLRIYDTHDFTEMKELLSGHRLPVTRLAFSHDSRYLATADTSGTISIFDWPLRRIVGTAKPTDHADGQYTAFDFAAGELFLIARGKAESAVVAIPSGKILADQKHVPPSLLNWLQAQPAAELPGGTATGFDLNFTRHAWLAGGIGKVGAAESPWVACWPLDSARPRCIYLGHQRRVTAVALSASCNLAASGDQSGAIHIWETTAAQPRYVLRDLAEPCYRAALDQASRSIGFAPQPLRGAQWGHNSFGKIDRVFDLSRRAIVGVPRGAAFPSELTQQGRARLALIYRNQRNAMQLTSGSGATSILDIGQSAAPGCFTLLGHRQLGVAEPVVVGDERGGLVCYDPVSRQPQCNFVGHTALVTSLSESADGRLLTTSSADGTIRLWSLAGRPAMAWVGFELSGDLVAAVPANGPAAKAGIRAGDRFLALDGKSLAEISAQRAAGKFNYKVGQRVLVELDRGGVAYQTEIPLVAGPDVVEPILTLLMTSRHEWIMWTPEGYYDASPGAGDLIGFHINRGPEQSARYLPVHQFRRQLYRPDVIDQVFAAAGVPEAVAAANAALDEAPPVVDLRQVDAIGSLSPPQVRILSPQQGTVTKEGQIHVLAEIVSQDGNPISDVRLLVNGRPSGQKGAAVVAEGTAQSRRSLSQAVTLLPGENTISLLASNARATSVPVTVTVTYEAPQEEQDRQPKLHLLSIGVSQYANQHLNLRYAHVDAQDFAAIWDTQRGRLYSDVATTLLVNEDASAERIRAAMSTLVASVDRRDVAVIFLSAHGVRDAQLDFYLGTHEIDPKNLPATGVHFREVTQLLEQLPCKVLMFVDTCHSAGITGAKSIAADPLYELTSDEYGAIVFASSLSREISLEDEAWGHGAFTKAILETFADQASDLNSDGYLSLTEMEQRVYDQVQKLTDGSQHPVMSRPATVPNLRFYQLGQPRSLVAQ